MILLGLKPEGDLIPHPGLLEQFKRRYLERGVPEAVGGSLTFSGPASLAEAQVLRAASSPVVYFDPDQNKAMDLLMEDPGAWVAFSDMLKLRLRNDYYGSSIADIFIADAIKIVKNTSGKYKGIGFRLGERSDEVAMVLPGSLDQQEVKNALQDIQQEIEKEYLGYCIARLPDGMDDKINGLDGVRVAQRTVRELRQGGYEYITTVFLVKDAGDISGRLTLNRILEQSGQAPGLGEVEEALPPYLPAGAARLQGKGAIENKFESSLKEAEIFQRVAKQAGQMVGVEGLIERPRIKDGARMPDYGFSKLKEYISEFNKSLQPIREFAKNRHGDNAAKQVQLDNGYAAFLRRNLFVVLEYAMEKMKSSDSFIFVVRGPPDNFYIITSGKGKWQVTAVRQNILTAEGATFEENFISIIEGSGRRLRAAGKFPFKVINDFDELGHYFGNQLIKLDNINLLGSFNQQILKTREGNGILDTQAISQALSNASKNISNLLNEHEFDFSVNFEAISVTSDDFVSGAIQSPADIAREALDIIDKLSSARKTVEVPGNSVKFYSEFKERWQEIENEIGFIAATKAKNAKIGLKETHKNINLPEEVSASSPVVTELIGLNPVSSSPITELRRAVQKLHNKKFNINGGIYVIRIENGDSVWDTSIVLRDKDNLEVGYFKLDTKSDAINNGGMLQIMEEKRRKGFALFILRKLREVFPENKELVTEIGHSESLKALRNNESINNLPIVQLFNAAGWELIELVYYDALGQYLKGDFSEQMSLDASKDEEGPVIARFKPKIAQPYLPGFNHPASSPAVDLLEQSFSADSRKIVEFAIDPFSPATIDGSLKNRLIEATDSGQVIKLNLSNLSFDASRFNQAMAVFNLLETILSEGLFTKLKVTSYDLRSAIRELLMNAFLHGNKLDFSLPIYLYFDFVNQKIEVYDLAVAQSQAWEQDQPEAEKAGIGGKGSGLKLLTQLGWGYALEPVRALNSDRQAGNKIVAYRSTPGGIDFRALPITSQPALVNQAVNANTIPPIPLAELNSEWTQIENMLAAGITPSSERIKEYLQSCCQKQDFNQDIDKVLSCIADMLRLEEERVVSTDLSLKEMLALLESGKPVNAMQLVLAQITVEAREPKLIE